MVKISDYVQITVLEDDDLFDLSEYDSGTLTYSTKGIKWVDLVASITSIPGPLGIGVAAVASDWVKIQSSDATSDNALLSTKSGNATLNYGLQASATGGSLQTTGATINSHASDGTGVSAGIQTASIAGISLASLGYKSIGLAASSGVNTTSSDSLAGYFNAAMSNVDDNYGIHVNTANAGAGTSYIGILDDGRTTGVGKVLTDIDGSGTAEWVTPGAGSSIYGIDGTLTGNRQLLGGGFSLEFGTGASQVSSLRAQSAGDIVFTGNGSYDIDLSGGIGNVNLTCGSGDMVLTGLGSCSIANQLGFEAVVGISGTIELTTPEATITSSPLTSAALDIDSTSQGFLPPRMTTAEMNVIISPAKGLMVYDTTTNQWMGNNGTPGTPNWVIIG